ncbi:MAG: dTMP kinase [Parvibaculum sp.]|uniref:dTMP kinase n=1 Tax=Parvibaculum sp. TaxID=2024848 RepID=UPI00284BC6C8|nr:dTMP kinase [Parvibaculum sp.]MDR3498623.1 dTMP kinase [Parvibaculum sp.]
MTAPRFITLEGGEGAGKSTQVRALASRLTDLGHKVTVTREPGGAPGAEAIRALLVNGDTGRWTPRAETLLHFAAREDHLARTIRPALERGAWVISDRFVDSTYAYQGVGQGVERGEIDALASMVIDEDMPVLTLILDLPVEVGLSRAHQRGGDDRYERMGVEFHIALRNAFLDIAVAHPSRCVVIDATHSVEDVSRHIWKVVTERVSL